MLATQNHRGTAWRVLTAFDGAEGFTILLLDLYSNETIHSWI